VEEFLPQTVAQIPSSYALKVVVLMRKFESQLCLEGSTNFVLRSAG